MDDNALRNIIDILSQIEKDFTVPKNVRIKVKNAYSVLGELDTSVAVRVDKSLQELDDISDDPNVSSYTRTQIWNVVSLLESISE